MFPEWKSEAYAFEMFQACLDCNTFTAFSDTEDGRFCSSIYLPLFAITYWHLENVYDTFWVGFRRLFYMKWFTTNYLSVLLDEVFSVRRFCRDRKRNIFLGSHRVNNLDWEDQTNKIQILSHVFHVLCCLTFLWSKTIS